MLLEILKRTPTWVFVLFAALVFFGVIQSRTRQITLAMNPGLAASPWLATGVSFAYGLMSGAFLARALRIFGARSRVLPS